MSVRPGRDAIDSVLAQLYGTTEPEHWTVSHHWTVGSADPLEGISAYARTDPVPHWHYITYGMSELDEKAWGEPSVSGWGFEFTFRLVGDVDVDPAPVWPAHFMQNLARYVFTSGKRFAAGQTIKANGPIAADHAESPIRAVGFATDPELGIIETVNGRVEFLQIVGLAETEYQAARGGKLLGVLDALRERLPLLVTDIDRASLLPPPAPRAQWPRWGGGLRGRG